MTLSEVCQLFYISRFYVYSNKFLNKIQNLKQKKRTSLVFQAIPTISRLPSAAKARCVTRINENPGNSENFGRFTIGTTVFGVELLLGHGTLTSSKLALWGPSAGR